MTSLKTSIKTITYLSDTGCLEIQGASLTHATGDYNVITGAYLGNITLKTEGTLTISANGSWTYNGVVRSYDDKYDFNASTHRGVIGESLTRLGAMFSGKEYQILLPGEIHIKESGKR